MTTYIGTTSKKAARELLKCNPNLTEIYIEVYIHCQGSTKVTYNVLVSYNIFLAIREAAKKKFLH